jgi:hypothetical protein
MRKTIEVLLIAWTLVGAYCAIPKSSDQAINPRLGPQQVVVVADGSDPMPICGRKVCK